MDEETLWILKKLSAREISARSADRILRALDLLRESEKADAIDESTIQEEKVAADQEDRVTAEAFHATQPIALTEDESLVEDARTAPVEVIEESAADADAPESSEVSGLEGGRPLEPRGFETRSQVAEYERSRVAEYERIEPSRVLEGLRTPKGEAPSGFATTNGIQETEAEVEGPDETVAAEMEEEQSIAVTQEDAPAAVEEPEDVIEEEPDTSSEIAPEVLDAEPLRDMEEKKAEEEIQALETVEPNSRNDDVEQLSAPALGLPSPEDPGSPSAGRGGKQDSPTPLAVQDSQDVIEEFFENAEEVSPEFAVTEEELPLTLEDEVDREAEPQEISLEISEEQESMSEEAEELISSVMDWEEVTDEMPLLHDDGVGIIENIPNNTGLILENAGNVSIQGWEQIYMRAEGEAGSCTILRAGKEMKIQSGNGITLYIPPTIRKVSVVKGSGSIDIARYPNDISIDRDTGDIGIREATGTIRAINVRGRITLEDCRGEISLSSNSGDIAVTRASADQISDVGFPESKTEDNLSQIARFEEGVATKVNVGTVSGNVVLTDVISDMNVKTHDGNVTIERCKGQSISAESNGGKLTLRNLVDSRMNLKSENSSITVEGFSGGVRVEARDTGVSLRKSGDAEIHIESDGGDINIEDCYADVHVISGTGNVHLSGGDLSFGGMGKVDLEMKRGDAYLHRRMFEDLRIVIEEGNAEVNMEKLGSDGSGQISVYKGNITARVLPTFGCELIAHGSRKKISIELPVEIIEREENRLRGTLNGGGSKIQLIAPNGGISFQALEQ